MILRAAAACLFSASAFGGSSQIDATPAENVKEPSQNVVISAKSVVEVELTEPISSKTNNLGDTFALKLVEPLYIDGRLVLPVGLIGRGEVTHAAKRGWGGKSGELIINARYLECGDIRIPLGHFHYSVTGKSNMVGAFATAQIVPLGQFLISGKEALIPSGSRGTAQVTASVTIDPNKTTNCIP